MSNISKFLGLTVSALALANCSDGRGGEDSASTAAANGAAEMQAQLNQLSEAQRNGVFMRAIRDARLNCQHVERSESAGEHQGLPLWRAWCENNTSYTIVIAQSGTAQVLADDQVRLSADREGGEEQKAQ